MENALSNKKDKFWDALPIPYQTEDEEYEFANPVVVQQQFLRLSRATAVVCQEAEDVTSEIADLENDKSEVQLELSNLRRQLFAANYKQITKSASSEVQDAFILTTARDCGREEELADLEEMVADLESRIRRLKPVQAKLWNRQNMIKQTFDYGKNYLDFEKVLTKIEHGAGRI